MDKVIIIGGKGTAINIAEHLVRANKYYNNNVEFIGFAIDDPSLGQQIFGFPIICTTSSLNKFLRMNDVKVIFALYKPEKMKERVALMEGLQIAHDRYYTFVDPTAYLAESVTIGKGTVILANTSIESNVKIGHNNIINSNVVIEHDAKINDCNFIAAKACIGANVIITNGCFIGLSSVIRENIRVDSFSFVGMGSCVTKHVPFDETVFGNPARAIK